MENNDYVIRRHRVGRKPRYKDPAFYSFLLKQYDSGKTMEDLAREYSACRQSIAKWLNVAREMNDNNSDWLK